MTTETTATYIWQPQTVDLEPIILFRVIVFMLSLPLLGLPLLFYKAPKQPTDTANKEA